MAVFHGKTFYTAPVLESHQIIVIDTADLFRVCSAHVLKPGNVVTIDGEWTPSLFHFAEQSLALLQLAVDDQVYILDIPALRLVLRPAEWTDFFIDLFSSEDIIKVGFSMASDLSILLTTFRELNRQVTTSIKDAFHPINMASVCDLYVRSLELDNVEGFFRSRDLNGDRIDPKRHDLSTVVQKTLGLPLNKELQLYNWDERPLSEEQLRYAAVDAYVLLPVYRYFENRLQEMDIKHVDLFKKLSTKFWNKLYGAKGREQAGC